MFFFFFFFFFFSAAMRKKQIMISVSFWGCFLKKEKENTARTIKKNTFFKK